MPSEARSVFRPGWFFCLGPAIASVCVAFYLGSIPVGAVLPIKVSWSDKLGHFLAFGLIQLTHVRAARFLYPEKQIMMLSWGAALSSAFFGGALEWWQATLPHRTAEFADFVADFLGAFAMALLYVVVARPSEPLGEPHR